MIDFEKARVDILVTASDALVRAGYPGPAIERQKFSAVSRDQADTLFAFQILNDPKTKGTEVGLMMELAQRTFWKVRKPESERLANMHGATISRIIDREVSRPHKGDELRPLEQAMVSFLLSPTVQALKN